MGIRKRDIMLDIAKKVNLTQTEVQSVIQRLIDYIINEMCENRRIELRNFGVFYAAIRRAKIGRNIKEGKVIQIPDRYVPAFKPGRTLKRKVTQNLKVKE